MNEWAHKYYCHKSSLRSSRMGRNKGLARRPNSDKGVSAYLGSGTQPAVAIKDEFDKEIADSPLTRTPTLNEVNLEYPSIPTQPPRKRPRARS